MFDYEYHCELVKDVVSLSRPKVKPHRPTWMLLAARDADCDIVVVDCDQDGNVEVCDETPRVLYGDLWAAIKDIAWPRISNWCLTFRSSHVLKQTRWLDALERGEIELERQRKLAGKQAGRGSVVLSSDMVDLDLRVGKRKVKLLDWTNYSVNPQTYVKLLNDLTGETCVRIFTDWIEAQTKVGLSASRTSAPQIGWTKLRQNLSGVSIFTSLDPQIRALERRSYYGGRCEPFRLGEVNEKCYLLDIRASYAALCAAIAVPVQPLRYWPHGFDVAKPPDDDNRLFTADCVIKTDTPTYPLRYCGRVIYPTGRFFTSLCGQEFYHAMLNDKVERVTSAASYAALPALQGYAQWYMESRDAIGTNGLANMAGSLKSIFNSSLGFLARHGREWHQWSPAGCPPWWFGKTMDPDNHGSVVGAHVLDRESEFLRIGHEPKNCAPIVHGAICAAARFLLHCLMGTAGKDNVIYCDTDGLIVTREGYDNLLAEPGVCGTGYGQLSIRAQSASCTINGQKNYKIGDKVVCAGLTADRHSSWRKKDVLDTPTGIVDSAGKVTPYVFDCEDRCDETAKWQNVLQ